MDDTDCQRIDASSMIDLKAELYRKQEALKLSKLKNDSSSAKRKGLKLKGEEVHKKVTKDSPLPILNISKEEEEEELKKSRLALERKAKLYEQILSRKVQLKDDDEDEDEVYMVDFRTKLMKNEQVHVPENNTKNSHETEKSEILPPSQKPNRQYEDFFVAESKDTANVKPSTTFSKESISNERGPIHYQNIQHNEVRDHGVGYYAFSMDEEKRKEQMDMLNTLRQQTEKRKAAFQNTKEKRRKALHARLAKICERRNIDTSNIDNFIPKSDEVHSSVEVNETTDIDVSNIPLPEGDVTNVVVPPPKPVKVRPWDEGKDFFGVQMPAQKSTKVTQKAWMEERRSERVDEFAPPSMYS